MIRNPPSPHRFATAIAERLNQVVPPGFSVRATGSSVDVYTRGDDRHASAGAEIIADNDGRSLVERMEVAARAILDGAQDGIMEILTEQWPLGPGGEFAHPVVRVDGRQLLMWFGEEGAPVIVLPPLSIDEIVEGAA